jgi:hypothetical protein
MLDAWDALSVLKVPAQESSLSQRVQQPHYLTPHPSAANETEN